MTSDRLTGRCALVTGAASGIGEATARRLAEEGADVIVADVDEAGAHRVATQIHGTPWVVDLLDSVALADDVLAQRLGNVDILVNNAGIQRVSPIQDFDPATFQQMVRLMLEVPFLLMRAALPGMYERGFGRIINITSVHGLRASPFKSAYVAAKHGLEGLSKVAALEGGPHGVTSNCVSPGYVLTPLVEKQVVAQSQAHGIPVEEVMERIMLTQSAIKEFIEPGEVAALVAWLASDEARMVTGASYTMDGGWSAH